MKLVVILIVFLGVISCSQSSRKTGHIDTVGGVVSDAASWL